MPVLGLHCSHEQVHPRAPLASVQQAEAAGFDAAMPSDHFPPWISRQGQSVFAWSWLRSALEATSLPFGVVNAPGRRHRPASIAQAIGTLGAMYAGRVCAALGSGEASNERLTGERWPRKDVRNARLRECVEIIRALLRGEEVSHDGLVTALQAHLSGAPDEREAEALAYEQWHSTAFPPPVCWDLDLVETVDAPSEQIPLERAELAVSVSADPGAHTAQLAEYAEPGFDKIFLHHVGQEQDAFVTAFGEKVLPQLRSAS